MAYDPDKVTFFAETDARGRRTPFGIKAKDRQRHMYVIGKTGMGKSTLLENMAAQDIMNGEGCAFIDPHGSAAETLLDYVPEHRIDDVIYFAPFDMDNPISFNVMEDVGVDKRHLVVSGLMSTFKKIWVDAWSARMEYILTNALLALIEYPDTTLLSVNRLFSDKKYRDKVVDYIKDPAVKAFWTEEFANYTERFAADALPAIQNKVGQFTGNPLIRNIIGQPHSSFDIRDIMDNRKILIMNLSKGLVGETNANLLGSMLTTRIYLAAMSRADLPIETMQQMPNFYFYVDEFQSFANSTFSNILSEARKYHLNLIIAHQYIAQMEEEVRDAVFGNVGTTVSFRVGPLDAEMLEQVFTPKFLAADMVNLGFAQIYLSLMIDGIGSPPFSAVTMAPIEKPSLSCKRMVIAASRRNYTRARPEVEQLVHELHTPEPAPPKPSPKSNGGNNKPKSGGSTSNTNANKSPSKPARTSSATEKKTDRSAPATDSSASLQHTLAAVQETTTTATVRQTTETKTAAKIEKSASPKSSHRSGDNTGATTDASQLSELRSVLAKISKTETDQTPACAPSKSDTKPAPKTSAKPAAKTKIDRSSAADKSREVRAAPARTAESKPQTATDPKADLRAALSSVMQKDSTASTPTDVKKAPPNQASHARSTSTQSASNSQKDTMTGAAASAKQSTDQAPSTTDADPLDPKHLKQMMRHDGSTKSPFA